MYIVLNVYCSQCRFFSMYIARNVYCSYCILFSMYIVHCSQCTLYIVLNVLFILFKLGSFYRDHLVAVVAKLQYFSATYCIIVKFQQLVA